MLRGMFLDKFTIMDLAWSGYSDCEKKEISKFLANVANKNSRAVLGFKEYVVTKYHNIWKRNISNRQMFRVYDISVTIGLLEDIEEYDKFAGTDKLLDELKNLKSN